MMYLSLYRMRALALRRILERKEYNVFHDFHRALVQALFDAGVSRNVYCVNIDAVIAALLLKMLWQPCQRGGRFPAGDSPTRYP